MNRIKSTLQDEELMLNENASSADRSTAAECLASDGFGKQIHPILDKWLNHKDFILRNTAISLLLGAWGHQKYVDKAIDLLNNDSNWSVRGTAARALSDFAKEFVEGEKQEERILKELLIALFGDNDTFSKQEIYKSVMRIVKQIGRAHV